jgi:hypothetical protein
MKRTGYRERSIGIPIWMNEALAELAAKHKRTITGEIQHILESSLVSAGFKVPHPWDTSRPRKQA